MSWKLAEWRWREQAPLREKSLWKIWDVQDAVKNGDVVEEAVRFAYHFPDQVNGCWQSRIELPQGGRLGSIRAATNPHPPPRGELPELPQQFHTSYRPSRSSSAPLLGSFEKSSLASGESTSTSSSISALLSKSSSSTPTVRATPLTPQPATDFLGSRDWNHLALDQSIDKNIAVDQLRSSFRCFRKLPQTPLSIRRGQLLPQYHRLERANTSAHPLLCRSAGSSSKLHRRCDSADLDASFNMQDRVLPWSNLDTVFEDQQFLLKHSFQEEGTIFEVLTHHDSFGEHPAEAPESSFEDSTDFHESCQNSASLLLPKPDMPRFPFGKSEEDENKSLKIQRTDTSLTKAFANVEHINPMSPCQEMVNETGLVTNRPPAIDLSKTPPRPGPASPGVYQALARQQAANYLNKTQKPYQTPEHLQTPLLPENPHTRLQALSLGPQGYERPEIENDNIPAGDNLSRGEQIRQLRHISSYKNLLSERVEGGLHRNSRSLFDFDHAFRGRGGQLIERAHPRMQERYSATTSDTVDSVNETYSRTGPDTGSIVLVRDSCDILDIAISGDLNFTRRGQITNDPAISGRRNIPPGEVPEAPLPLMPARRHQRQYLQTEVSSSEVAQYDNTESLLNVRRYDPHTHLAKNLPAQVSKSRRETENSHLRNDSDNPTDPHLSGGPGPGIYDDDLESLAQLGAGASAKKITVSATAPNHAAIQDGHLHMDNRDHRDTAESAEHHSPSSGLPEEANVPQLTVRNLEEDSGEVSEQEQSFVRTIGSGMWLGKSSKKNFDKEPKEEISEDSRDWETDPGSWLRFDLPSRATLQPRIEPLPATPNTTDPLTEPSLANMSTPDNMSFGEEQPASPWDAIPKGAPRTHPALPGTPHKMRLRRNPTTGEEFLVPEYTGLLPEVGQHSSDPDPFRSSHALRDLPEAYILPVSKFSASTTPRQQALGEETSLDKTYLSSPPVFTQARRKARMAAAMDGQDLAQDRTAYEVEGEGEIGVAVSTDNGPRLAKQHLPNIESVYSLASNDITQEGSNNPGADALGPRPANIPAIRDETSYPSSDELDLGDGNNYGEQGHGIEMTNMGQGRDISIGTMGTFTTRSEYTSSEASLPHQSHPMSQGPNESDEDILKRLSTIGDDGSYEGDDDDASVSSFLRANNPMPPRAQPLNRILVGARNTFTGSLRRISNSQANMPSDVYNPAMQRCHPYTQLSSGPDNINKARNENATGGNLGLISGQAMLPAVLFTREQIQETLRNKGVDLSNMPWADVQTAITGIRFPNGEAISGPKPAVLRRVIPDVNSFTLTKDQPLLPGAATHEEIENRINMANDDWFRLTKTCPMFPLRDEHLDMGFLEDDPRPAGDPVCTRGDVSRINGYVEEDAFCFAHIRREFSTRPALRSMPLSAENERIRKEAGRKLVWILLSVPQFGWIFLYFLWKDQPGMRVDGELMRWMTGNLIQDMGDEEKEFAGDVLLALCAAMAAVFLGVAGVTIWRGM